MKIKSIQEYYKWVILLPLFLVGLGMRVIGFDWGGRSVYQADEAKLVDPVLVMAGNHSLISGNYYYPNQFLSKIQALVLIVLRFFNIVGVKDEIYGYWVCRIVTALCGTVTILIVYLIGEKLKENVGLISVALFSVSPSMIIMSKQVTGDVGALFGSAITVLFALKYIEERKIRFVVLMSLGTAMSMMEKWHGGGGTVFIAFIIILCSRTMKDIFYGAIVALISFVGGVFLIAPNVILDYRNAFINGFLKIAVYKGEKGPGYVANLGNYLQWGYLHVGGFLYVTAVLVGIVIIVSRRDKRYCVLSIGIIKVLELCVLNRSFPRWGLELYFSEIICIAITLQWMLSNKNYTCKVAGGLILSIIVVEGLSASLCIDLVAVRNNQDVRAMQEGFCCERGIVAEDTISAKYSAFQPGGIRSDGVAEEAKEGWENVLTYKKGVIGRTCNKDYFVWTACCGSVQEIMDYLERKDLCIWSMKTDYNDIFFNPIWRIDHSWNDFSLIKNNIVAFLSIKKGAVLGLYDIKIYDISSIPVTSF